MSACQPVSPSQWQRGSTSHTNTRAPHKQNRRVRLDVYGIGVYVDHTIACGRRCRPADELFMKTLPAMRLLLWCCVLCVRAAAGVCVSGGSVRTMYIPLGAPWVVLSIYCIVSKRLNPYDTRYDTILDTIYQNFRYDIQHYH